MRLNKGWLAAVASGVVGVGVVLGSGVASGAPRVGQPLFGGYTMMIEPFGGRGGAGAVTSTNFVQFHQNMFVLHAAMLRYARDTFGATRGFVGPYMSGANGRSSQGDLGDGYMMGGYLPQGSSAQGGAYGPMMGGY